MVTRNAARNFFISLKKIKKDNIILDFSGVVFMSRSFADECITRKNDFDSANISEVNMTESVKRTLEAVSDVRTTRIELPKLRAQRLSF